MIRVLYLVLCSVVFANFAGAAGVSRQTCQLHIAEIEKKKGIEPGLLEAIAQIESKFNPFIVNACGRAFNFGSAEEAAKFVRAKQKEGYQNISVGPMQLHVPSHRSKFKTLEDMLRPEANIECAANLLKRLKRQTGSSEGAVKLYHSPDPEANEPYKDRVFGAWAKIRVKRKKVQAQEVAKKDVVKVAPQPKGILAVAAIEDNSQKTDKSKKKVNIRFSPGSMVGKK